MGMATHSLLAISLLSWLINAITVSGIGGYTIDGRIQNTRNEGRDIMPRRPNPLWAEHTNVLRVVNTSGQAGSGTRTWVCKYCGEQMTSTIIRVLKHLTGIGTTGHCGGCEAVPPALRDALILEHFPPGSTASSQSGGARAAAIAAEDALQDALLGDIGGSASALPSFAGTSGKRARVSQAEDEGASASAASTGGNGVPFKSSNVKISLNFGQKVAFIRPDGYFAFTGIPAGTHLLEVVAPGYSFSPVRVDVSARLNGQLQATLTETRRILSEPLVLEPLREETYFEKREPFSLMGLLKSPMGLMVGFMAVAAILLPKLMENIDPEEMKKMQEEMRTSSLTNVLQGRSS
ncbi:hypothetical protein L7F22_056346 [Adiantum nelumboides]|nr:hypothetical protein [Adiantum nelumboides]